MKILPLEHYPPLAQRAIVFYRAALTLNVPQNRTTGSWITAFYSLSHALELAIKSVYEAKESKKPSWGHKLVPLGKKYQVELDFTEEDLRVLKEFDKLNSGHGLRYVNQPETEFYPDTFNNGVQIVQSLLEYFESYQGLA